MAAAASVVTLAPGVHAQRESTAMDQNLDRERAPGPLTNTQRAAPVSRSASAAEDADDEEPPARAAASDRDPTLPPVRPFHVAQNAAWVEPIFPVVGLIPGVNYYNTNIGYSHSLTRGLDLNVQAGIGSIGQYTGSSTRFPTGGLSVGLTIFLTGSEPMNGLFIAPKIAFSAGYDGRLSVPTNYLGAGIDIGFQYAVGGFFIAPVLGVEMDAAFPGTASFPGAPTNNPYYATRINLAGFRIGWTFDGQRGSIGEHTRAVRLYGHEAHGFDPARDHRPRSIAFWTWPAWMAIGPLFNRYNVGLGATVALADRIHVVVEGTYEWGAMRNTATFGQANYSRFDAAIGVALVLYPTGGGLGGLFLQPKLYGNALVPGSFGGFAPSFGGGVGLDIGWAFVFGPIYVAPVFGFRLGATAVSSPGVFNAQQPTGFTPDLNFTIMRMGLAF